MHRARIPKVRRLVYHHIGSILNLVTSTYSKIIKKIKSPGVSKTKAATRSSPYKQSSLKNMSLYDTSVRKPVTNRNQTIFNKDRKCLINTTFWNEDKNKIGNPRPSVQKGDHKCADRLKMDKKLKKYFKQTDGFLNFYAKAKKSK
jgi:hypothetical protein